MSFRTLGVAASALYASQRAVEAASHNVANATTPGYTRQRLAITSATPTPGTPGVRGDGMRGTGVTVVAIDRLRDTLADVAYRSEATGSGFASARADVLDRAQGVLGPYGAATKALGDFRNAWVALNDEPADPGVRANVLSKARQLTELVNDAARSLEEITVDVGLRIRNQVTEVNHLAEQVTRLNQGIADAKTAGQSPNDLLDQRDAVLDELAAKTGATFQTTDLDMVDVYVGNSVLVAGVTTRPLEATSSAGVTAVRFADGGSANPGGEMGGYISAMSEEVTAFRAQLDQFAVSLAATVNDVHTTNYDLGGEPGQPFFTGTTASSLRVNPALTPEDVAAAATPARFDGAGAKAIADRMLEGGALPDGSDLTTGLNAFAVVLGEAAASSAQSAEAAAAGTSAATRKRAESNGVSTDEEMVDLLKFQHAYSAAARVLSVADEMLDQLINRTGAR